MLQIETLLIAERCRGASELCHRLWSGHYGARPAPRDLRGTRRRGGGAGCRPCPPGSLRTMAHFFQLQGRMDEAPRRPPTPRALPQWPRSAGSLRRSDQLAPAMPLSSRVAQHSCRSLILSLERWLERAKCNGSNMPNATQGTHGLWVGGGDNDSHPK